MPGRRSWLGLQRIGSPRHGRLSFSPKEPSATRPQRFATWPTCTVRLTARSVIATCQRNSDAELTTQLAELASDEHDESIQAKLDSVRETARVLQTLANEDARLISDRDRNLRTVRLERREGKEDIARIEGELAEIGEDVLRALTSERNERTEQIARDKQRHDDGGRKLKDQELQIDELKGKLEGVGQARSEDRTQGSGLQGAGGPLRRRH